MFPNTPNGYVVGAYPASPAHKSWLPQSEKLFFAELEKDERIAALELPWMGSLHPHDDSWFLENFPTRWSAVITDIPFVMSRLAQNGNYGLASRDKHARRQAMHELALIPNTIKKFDDATGMKTVIAVEIHSAPSKLGDIDAFSQSLLEIGEWDWSGAELLIEHCDAHLEHQNPEKGFMTLVDEIRAIEIAQVPIRILLNWGRSAIEFRNAAKVVEHISTTYESGYLAGIIFSGASQEDGAFGRAWVDAHHPFCKSDQNPFGDPASLLTLDRARQALEHSNSLDYLGIKMGWRPDLFGSIEDRAAMISSALDSLDSVRH